MTGCPGHLRTALSRREFLWQLGGGLGGVALTAMLEEARAADNPLSAKLNHHAAKAKAVIQIFCPGATPDAAPGRKSDSLFAAH